jgi:hypothetical protein
MSRQKKTSARFENDSGSTPRLKVGQPITPEQFEALDDEQLSRLVPRAYREFFPGKDFCADGSFYLHDGNAWSFFKGGFLDD